MDKDRLIEEMLKGMGDKNNTIDLNAYGRGLIDMHDRLVKNCSIPDVVGQSKQLVLFADWLQYNGKWDLPEKQVEKFLKEQKQN